MRKYIKLISLMLVLICAFTSCNNKSDVADETDATKVITPVQVTTFQDSSISEYVSLSAVSAYLEKSFVKANINGYVENVAVKTGDLVGNGRVLFSLITKEARSIGNTVNGLDPAFKFSGKSVIRSGQAGIIMQVNHQNGDYVQDGEALATISNRNSLVFLLDLPYEYNQIVKDNKIIKISLPDGTSLSGAVSGTLPSVDSLAQTQRYIIKIQASKDIPAGLIGRVKLTKTSRNNARILPKSAVLSNETEDEFWVMKMINDSTAVKVAVKKGIENKNIVEILEPKFEKNDRIVTTGNYGIADTAKVKIQK